MKNLLKQNEFQLDEILFENRNKAYGAYMLRNNADYLLTKALFLGIGFFALVATIPIMINAFRAPVINVPTVGDTPVILKNITEPIDPPVTIPVKVQPKVTVNTIDSRLANPTRNAKKETVMPKQSEYDKAVIGTVNIVGEPPIAAYQPPASVPVPAARTETAPVKPADNSPKTSVDIEAVFNGGINAFRNKVVSNFDTSVMEGTGEVVKTTVIFIVEKDGSISDVTATGANSDFNRAAVKTIKSIKGKWVPAKINGENVRSYFKFPISMQFE